MPHHLSTLLAQAGTAPDPMTGALATPIHLATTYEREADGTYPHGFVYSRWSNPTRLQLEETLATLEGGAACAAFASGMAAANAVCQSLRPGDHVLFSDDTYHGCRHLLETYFVPWGLTYTMVDLTDLDAVEAAFRPETVLLWAETPTNPLVNVCDLAVLAEQAHAAGARMLVDSTWATPVLQQPLKLGANLVLHSVTKYLSGHSDVLGGALVTRTLDDEWEQIQAIQRSAGAVCDPFSAWLTLRGIRSLGARMPMQCAHARQIARFLADHPAVTKVHHPSLPNHAGHAIAQKQMSDFGAMISFEVNGGRDTAMAIAARVQVFTRATSLGGTESLIEHRASVEGPLSQTPEGLLRLSIGLEHLDDLLSDLDQALRDVRP